VIHQPLSVVSQCGAGIWLAPGGDQRRLTGSGSALEAITRNALYNPRLLTLLCWLQCVSFKAGLRCDSGTSHLGHCQEGRYSLFFFVVTVKCKMFYV